MPGSRKKICVIKLGGLGDVLRTTPLLWRFQDADVTWITQEYALPLLKGNACIERICDTGGATGLHFDELYNFDEDPLACALAADIPAKKKKGYGLKNGCYFPFDTDSGYAYELSRNDAMKFRLNAKTYQEIIFEMAGVRWNGEDYALGYRPKSPVKYAVGINYLAGDKFPNKSWLRWKELADMLGRDVSVQRQFGSLEEYIEWISSCRIVVTGDSLGMHLALALKKMAVILMGPTSWNEIETYGRGVILKSGLPCSPCYKKTRCERLPFCMDLIRPAEVYSEIKKMEGKKGAAKT